jgi:PAS domain S-box-containing protein
MYGLRRRSLTGGPDLVFDVIKVPTFHSDGSRKELVVIARDITEIKRIESVLRNQRDEYQTIFDSVPSIIWYVDRAGTILRANRVAVSAVGLAARQLIGMSIYDLFPSHEAEKFIADNLEVISKGRRSLASSSGIRRPAVKRGGRRPIKSRTLMRMAI